MNRHSRVKSHFGPCGKLFFARIPGPEARQEIAWPHEGQAANREKTSAGPEDRYKCTLLLSLTVARPANLPVRRIWGRFHATRAGPDGHAYFLPALRVSGSARGLPAVRRVRRAVVVIRSGSGGVGRPAPSAVKKGFLTTETQRHGAGRKGDIQSCASYRPNRLAAGLVGRGCQCGIRSAECGMVNRPAPVRKRCTR